jgi:hypothetical protein
MNRERTICLLLIDKTRSKDKTYLLLFIINRERESYIVLFVIYESINRKVKIKYICECRCYERLQTKTKEFIVRDIPQN